MNCLDIPLTINIKGALKKLSPPIVMGILNITPDSFYAGSRKNTEKEIRLRIEQILAEGASIIDVGGCSSRPNAAEVSREEEMERLSMALKIIRSDYPDATVSVDTFRAEVAEICVEEYGVAIVNDISGGMIDDAMFNTIARLNVPYVLSHIKGNPATMVNECRYDDLISEIILYFSEKIGQLRQLGVNDIIIDPGFGFAKDLNQNYLLMKNLEALKVFGLPILIGVSRKRMVYQLLQNTPEESLNGTTVLNAYALLQGVSILRVHDVKEAMETIKIIEKLTIQA